MRVLDIILEASGGMWDRMHERRMGKLITFSKAGQTLDLLDVQVFPQDPRLTSYKDTTGTPIAHPSQWTGRQQLQPPQQTIQKLQTQKRPQQLTPVEPIQEPEEDPEQLAERANIAPTQAEHIQPMLDDILAWIQSQHATIEYAEPPKNTDAAAIVVILGNEGKKVAFVKWAKKKASTMPPIFWKTIEFERATGWIQGNAGKSAVAKAAAIKIDPSDFVVAEKKYAIASIPAEVSKNLETRGSEFPPELKSGIPKLLDDLLNNETPVPVPDIDHYHREIEVVLGETAAPIALSSGKRVSGSWSEVQSELLKPEGLSWANFTEVTYGKKGGKLEDCAIYAGEFKLLVSSKDSTGGSPASLTGFVETLDKRPEEFGPGTKFYKKYKNILDIIRTLYDYSAKDGIVLASVQLGIINKDEARYILSIYGGGAGSMADVQNYPNLPEVLKAKKIMGQSITNKAGQQVASKQGVDLNNHKYQLGYHLLGNLAVMIKKKLNEDVPKITQMFKSVLNRADMVQVYTKVKKNNQGIWYDDFNVVWPPTFNGTIQIESDHYTANAKAGKKISFVFK